MACLEPSMSIRTPWSEQKGQHSFCISSHLKSFREGNCKAPTYVTKVGIVMVAHAVRNSSWLCHTSSWIGEKSWVRELHLTVLAYFCLATFPSFAGLTQRCAWKSSSCHSDSSKPRQRAPQGWGTQTFHISIWHHSWLWWCHVFLTWQLKNCRFTLAKPNC